MYVFGRYDRLRFRVNQGWVFWQHGNQECWNWSPCKSCWSAWCLFWAVRCSILLFLSPQTPTSLCPCKCSCSSLHAYCVLNYYPCYFYLPCAYNCHDWHSSNRYFRTWSNFYRCFSSHCFWCLRCDCLRGSSLIPLIPCIASTLPLATRCCINQLHSSLARFSGICPLSSPPKPSKPITSCSGSSLMRVYSKASAVHLMYNSSAEEQSTRKKAANTPPRKANILLKGSAGCSNCLKWDPTAAIKTKLQCPAFYQWLFEPIHVRFGDLFSLVHS